MKYPVFVAEQVLTAKNLNDIINFFNEQDLSTRRNLIGIGIACGMELSSDGKSYVKINCGCGVTSLGILVDIPEQEMYYYRKYKDLASKPYDKFLKEDKTQYDLWELLTQTEYEEADDPDNDHPIAGNTDFEIEDTVCLIYVELINKDLDNCIDEGCDEKGIARLFNLRKLLIKKSDLFKIIAKKSTKEKVFERIPSEYDIFKKTLPLANLPVILPHRLNYNLSDLTGLNLSNINNWQKLRDSFLRVIKADVVKIANALYQSYELYKNELINLYPSGNPFNGFENTGHESNALFHIIETELNKNDITVQYAYDFVCDLMKAYDEFLDTAMTYNSKCCIDPELFPYHLLLGVAIQSSKKYERIYRHTWQPSPAVAGMNDTLDNLRFLHFKIYQLINNFNLRTFTNSRDIVITPGKFSGQPFSDHSIAHYYSNGVSGEIHKYWNFELTKKFMEDSVLSYFPKLYSSLPFILNPLLYSLRDFEYFRIEGHIGQEYGAVLGKLRQLIKDYNLPFDLLGIKLSSDYLDIEIEDNCFNDIQTAYKCNRDEYLACIKPLANLINAFIKAINLLKERYPNLLNQSFTTKGNFQLGFINNYQQLFIILQLYAHYLDKVRQDLPEHVKDFKYDDFRQSYFIVFAFSLFCQIYLEYLTNHIEEFSGSFLQLMMLKTMFERLLDDCMDSKFESIYNMYRERLIKMQLGRLFPGYVTGSPGIEHIAGVKEGGTFILVYDDMPEEIEEEKKIPEEPPVPEDICFEDEESKQLQLTVLQYAHVIMNEPVLIEEYKDRIESVSREGVFFRMDDPGAYKRTVMDSKTEETFEEKESEPKRSFTTYNRVLELKETYKTKKEFFRYLFGEKTEFRPLKHKYRVVADFAVPFRCCSTCLQVDELPAPDLSINIDPGVFCKRDARKYPVIVNPEGGQLISSGGGIMQENVSGMTHHYFIPANSTDGEELTLTYNYEGKSVKTVIYVYNPVANFEVRMISSDRPPILTHASMQIQINAVAFINTSQNADRYEWRIPALEYVSSEKDISIPLEKLPGEFEVRLTAYRGKCEHVKSEVVKIRENQDVIFELRKPENQTKNIYCNNDPKEYDFLTIPAGDIVEGPNVIKNVNDGKYYFKPYGLKEGKYIFTWMDKKIEAQILKAADIQFDIKPEKYNEKDRIMPVSFIFVGEMEDVVTWNFGDGKDILTSRELIISRNFYVAQQTKFTVSIQMRNKNGCKSFWQRDVDLSPYIRSTDVSVGIVDLNNYGTINMKNLMKDERAFELKEYNYTAAGDMIKFHETVEKDNISDLTRREAFSTGKMNVNIAERYTSAFEETKKAILTAKEKGDQKMLDYFMQIYLGEMQMLIATIGALDKEPAKNSNLYQTLIKAGEHLRDLAQASININPDGDLKAIIEMSAEKLSDKNNVRDFVNNLNKMI